MKNIVTIKSVLISVFNKDGVLEIAKQLKDLGVKIYSTGGTLKYMEAAGIEAESVESITDYPSILGGRVKTLHPKVFGGILHRRDDTDKQDLESYNIPSIDLVICDLYPFKETVKQGVEELEIIEKIDIGGVSLIRAGAKNYYHTVVVSNKNQYPDLIKHLEQNKCSFSLEKRREYAQAAFLQTLQYDAQIFSWFSELPVLEFTDIISSNATRLRYGENPHQEAVFMGDFNKLFTQLSGKSISYNNLLDVDAGIGLVDEFNTQKVVAIMKHNNACCFSQRETIVEAWKEAIKGDEKSAFGGIVVVNDTVDIQFAKLVHELFFEIIVAPDFDKDALDYIKTKKNRIILQRKTEKTLSRQVRTVLNGLLVQSKDDRVKVDIKDVVTKQIPSNTELEDLYIANILNKHYKSNAITLVKDKKLIGYGCGQTSRIDALEQAIERARVFGFDTKGAVMASDAFFPFSDCVEIASKAGITTVIQPGGSIRDKESIRFCDDHNMGMLLSGIRHFKH